MDLSHHNIQRIEEWSQSDADYNFLNPGYTISLNYDQVLLEQNYNEFEQIFPHSLSVPRYSLVVNADSSHFFDVSKNIKDIDLCLTK